MVKDEKPARSAQSDGFPARLRQVVASYGSTSALAREIERSEGAVRKWLRGVSEPAVSDLVSICSVTGTNAEWLVMGTGQQHGLRVDDASSGGSGGEGPLAELNYKLMDDVVLTIRLEPRIAGAAVSPEKCASIITAVYNLSRVNRRVDREAAERIASLAI